MGSSDPEGVGRTGRELWVRPSGSRQGMLQIPRGETAGRTENWSPRGWGRSRRWETVRVEVGSDREVEPGDL